MTGSQWLIECPTDFPSITIKLSIELSDNQSSLITDDCSRCLRTDHTFTEKDGGRDLDRSARLAGVSSGEGSGSAPSR